jgi:hypothetical protein
VGEVEDQEVREDAVDLQRGKKRKKSPLAKAYRPSYSAAFWFIRGTHSDDHVGTGDPEPQPTDTPEIPARTESRSARLLARLDASESSYADEHAEMMRLFRSGDLASARLVARRIQGSRLTAEQSADVDRVLRLGER